MDELEARIAELREQEELDAIRPPLDGNAGDGVPGRGAGPVVGEALDFLLEARLDEGPIDEATPTRGCGVGRSEDGAGESLPVRIIRVVDFRSVGSGPAAPGPGPQRSPEPLGEVLAGGYRGDVRHPRASGTAAKRLAPSAASGTAAASAPPRYPRPPGAADAASPVVRTWVGSGPVVGRTSGGVGGGSWSSGLTVSIGAVVSLFGAFITWSRPAW